MVHYMVLIQLSTSLPIRFCSLNTYIGSSDSVTRFSTTGFFYQRNELGLIRWHRYLDFFSLSNFVKLFNPLPHGRKTSPTPRRQVMIERAKRRLQRAIPARRHISALVPAYEVCVCEWLDRRRGPLKIFHLHRESAQSGMCGGPPVGI